MNAITEIANDHCQLSSAQGALYTNIWGLLCAKYLGSVCPSGFFPELRPCLENSGLFSEWVLLFFSKHFQNQGLQCFFRLIFPLFYCGLNLTPCRHCISVKFPLHCVRQDLGLFISPGTGFSLVLLFAEVL